jgi:HSP20 family molecular chaperone IbpA
MNFFDDIDEIFERQLKTFRRFFEDLPTAETPSDALPEEHDGVRIQRFGPFVYGRITTMGPDGKVETREWGNMPSEFREGLPDQKELQPFTFTIPPRPQERRPSPIPNPLTPDRPFPIPDRDLQSQDGDYLIDIMETPQGYTVLFDTPATEAEDVKAHVEGRQLQLWIQGRLFRKLELPNPVELAALHVKNGTVELQLHSKKPKEEPKASGEVTDSTA